MNERTSFWEKAMIAAASGFTNGLGALERAGIDAVTIASLQTAFAAFGEANAGAALATAGIPLREWPDRLRAQMPSELGAGEEIHERG